MKKLLVFAALFANIAAIYYGIIPTDYDFYYPGGIYEVNDRVEIEGSFDQEGSFNTVYVKGIDRPTRLLRILAEPISFIHVRELTSTESLLSNSELSTRGKILYETGVEFSLIHAYEAAGKDIKYFLDSATVVYYYPDYNDVEMGLEITGINGIDYDSYNELVDVLLNSEEATLNTKQGDFAITKKDGKYGIVLTPNFLIYESSPEFTIANTNVTGSSGGLLQTLSIFNQLTETDYTLGKIISGTGTITTNGSVGAIGGVEQKVMAAHRENVDIFFVPAENYDDAIKTKHNLKLKIEIVRVEFFQDAVDYLMKEAGEIDG